MDKNIECSVKTADDILAENDRDVKERYQTLNIFGKLWYSIQNSVWYPIMASKVRHWCLQYRWYDCGNADRIKRGEGPYPLYAMEYYGEIRNGCEYWISHNSAWYNRMRIRHVMTMKERFYALGERLFADCFPSASNKESVEFHCTYERITVCVRGQDTHGENCSVELQIRYSWNKRRDYVGDGVIDIYSAQYRTRTITAPELWMLLTS